MNRLRKLIPMGGWLSSYRKEWLRFDVVAGLTAAAVVIPQAMAYGAIASLPLVVGLYTALVPQIIYAVMGTSRSLSVTTTSTIAILTGTILHEVVPGGEIGMLIRAVATLTLLVAAVLLVASVFRLGFVANFISEPVLVGFKAGIGIVIVVDQIPKLLGLHFPKGKFFQNISSIVTHFPEASMATAVFGGVMVAMQFILKRYMPRWPAALVTVAVGIGLSAFAGVDKWGIALVGEVKGGLPSLVLPNMSLLNELWPAAVGIALISFVETIAAGKAFIRQDEPRPSANRELVALGLSNLFGGFLQSMPSGGGTSQTAVNSQAGARTQVSALVTAGMVVAVLFFLAPLVHLMPQATLASVVVVPCIGMIHLQEFREIRRARYMEFSWALASVAGVILLGTLRGIMVAVLLSLVALAYHANRRPVFVLGRKPGTEVFRPKSPVHPEDEFFPGLLLLKTEGIIHFANAQRIGELLTSAIEQNQPKVVVIDCSAIPDFEYTALKMLIAAEQRLQREGISLWLAALNPQPLELIQKGVLGQTLGRQRMYFNVEQAVRSFQQRFMEQEQTSVTA